MSGTSLNMETTCDDYRWLVEHADRVLHDPAIPNDPVRFIAYLRKNHSPNRSRLLAELRELRQRAKSKFSMAARMFFTRLGLEQATDETLAAYKASRFPLAVPLADLCCGVGGDTIHLAQKGPVTAVDIDQTAVALAKANLRAVGLHEGADVRCADVRNVDLSPFAAWHLDPDRRPLGQRRSAPARCEPPLSESLRLLGRSPNAGIKFSPAADVGTLAATDIELEWLGHSRHCQQLVAWFGTLARFPGKRAATWLWRDADGQSRVSTIVQEPTEPVPVVGTLSNYLYEPQPPVLAAKLEDVLAAQYQLNRVASGIAYFTTDRRIVEEPLLKGFEILDTLPLKANVLRRRITELNGFVTEVKKRGVNTDPHRLQRQLPLTGEEPLTVILFTVRRSVRAVLAKRLGAET